MRRHLLETSQWVRTPIETTFAFFSDPGNLARITPPGLGFVILTPGPVEMRAGTRIEHVDLRYHSGFAARVPGFRDKPARKGPA